MPVGEDTAKYQQFLSHWPWPEGSDRGLWEHSGKPEPSEGAGGLAGLHRGGLWNWCGRVCPLGRATGGVHSRQGGTALLKAWESG